MTDRSPSSWVGKLGPWGAAVFIVAGGLLLWQGSTRGWWNAPAEPATSNRQTPEPTTVTPRVGSVATYPQEMEKVIAPLRVAIEADDQTLIAAAAEARTGLMALVVPAEARERHLALVLVLTRIGAASPQSAAFTALRTDLSTVLPAP